MLGRLRWKVVGLMLLLLGFGGLSVLVFNVLLIPLVHTALIPHTSPLVAPICPGMPECG